MPTKLKKRLGNDHRQGDVVRTMIPFVIYWIYRLILLLLTYQCYLVLHTYSVKWDVCKDTLKLMYPDFISFKAYKDHRNLDVCLPVNFVSFTDTIVIMSIDIQRIKIAPRR